MEDLSEQQFSEGDESTESYYDYVPFTDEDGVVYGAALLDFFVPPDLRRNGAGSKMYREFEADLPDTVKIITLIAADLGTGPTQPYWAARGFVPLYDYSNAKDEVSGHLYYFMDKGVNGGPQPEPQPMAAYEATTDNWPFLPMMDDYRQDRYRTGEKKTFPTVIGVE